MALQFCSLASGSSGNCQLIMTPHTKILLDAGLSGKYIINGLSQLGVDASEVEGILITHEHSDHIKGIGIMHRKYGMKIYANQATWDLVKGKIGKVDERKVVIISALQPFDIQDIHVKAMSIAHDAVDPLAYSFETDHAKLSILTDLGHITPALIDQIKDSDMLMLEANHNVEMLKMGSYPYYLKRRVMSQVGHLSNEDCGDAVVKAIQTGRVTNVVLGHLSRENNTPELAYETVKSIMHESGMVIDRDVQLALTYRDRIGHLFRIKR